MSNPFFSNKGPISLSQIFNILKITNEKKTDFNLFDIKDLKHDFVTLKKISIKRDVKFPKKYSEFKKLLNSDNFNRLKCIFLPFDAVIKALKL